MGYASNQREHRRMPPPRPRAYPTALTTPKLPFGTISDKFANRPACDCNDACAPPGKQGCRADDPEDHACRRDQDLDQARAGVLVLSERSGGQPEGPPVGVGERGGRGHARPDQSRLDLAHLLADAREAALPGHAARARSPGPRRQHPGPDPDPRGLPDAEPGAGRRAGRSVSSTGPSPCGSTSTRGPPSASASTTS